MLYFLIAMELANERAREARQRALIAAAGHVASTGGPLGPRRPNRARVLIARPVRALSDASHAFSEAACSAATAIEGSTH
ncbi:MAG TPA: hypothetical protein VIH37_01695 [Candidatus Limnocylindrales bacterium]